MGHTKRPGRKSGVRHGAWLWRWRRNPLRDRSYAAQAWLGLAVIVLAVAGGVAAGVAAGLGTVTGTDHRRAERHHVVAVLTDEPAATSGFPAQRSADIVWTAPDGRRLTGETHVGSGVRDGDRITVWADRRGALVAEPLPVAAARVEGVMTGVAAAAGVAGLGVVLLAVSSRLFDRRRADRLAAEWADVGPRWDRHAA